MRKIFALAIFVSVLGVSPAFAQTNDTTTSTVPAPVACRQDAKVCPDGTTVSRVAPSCEFAQCPKRNTSSTKPAIVNPGIGQSVSEINKDAEEQIKALRLEMEAKIKGLKEEYESKIKAIRENSKIQIKAIQENKGVSTGTPTKIQEGVKSRIKDISTTTKRFFLLRWLGRE